MVNIIFGALFLSIWATILFFGKNIGLSVLLFVVPFIYILLNILEKKKKVKYRKARILILPIVLLASTYFIYNNSLLNKLNLIVIPTLILILIMELLEKDLKLYSRFERIIEIIFNPINYLDVTMKKCKTDVISKLNFKEKTNKNTNFGKAILITIPVVFVVILLLSTADDVFGELFVNIFRKIVEFLGNFNLGRIIGRLVVIVCLFIYFAAFFDHLVSRYDDTDRNSESNLNSNDNTTVKLLLGVLNIVYVIFCFIQIKALFMKVNVEDYSYYARKGFFQLMVVSFINFVIILIAKSYEKSKKSKYVNVMSIIMIACTFIILLSAAYRMRLYESAYGYTLLRLLVYVALFTESILLIPTIIYVIDKPINLIKSYFTITLVVYVCLNFVNLDNVIMKNNVDRYFVISSIDLPYLRENTGTDGIKQLSRILEAEPINQEQVEIQKKVKEYIQEVHDKIEPMDFRDFNISKYRVEKKDFQNVEVKKNETEQNEIEQNESKKKESSEAFKINSSEEDLKLEKEHAMNSGESVVKVGNVILYSGMQNRTIYKVDLESKSISKLCDTEGEPKAIYFDGEYVYYVPYYYSEKGVYRVDMQGNSQKIYNGTSLKLWLTEDKIYFIDQIGFDDMNQNPQGNLCKMNKDGSGKEIVITGVRNNFVIYKDKIYYSDLTSKAACVANLDGTNKKELISGRITIGTVNDNYITGVDFSSNPNMKVCNLKTGEVQALGNSGNFVSFENLTYVYTRDMLAVENPAKAPFSLFELDGNNNKKELFQDTDVGLNYILHVYKDYAYFNVGNEFYRINLNSAHKENIDGYRNYINNKAYLFKRKEQEILSLKIYDLEKNLTSEISFES